VHLGHLDVIRHVVVAAKAEAAQPALITFEPHPRCVLDPANCPQSITTLSEKLALLEGAGIEHAIVIRFDRALAALSPQEFIDRLSAVMDIRRWVIGYDFAFGRGRTGNAEWLRAQGHQVEVVAPFTIEGRELHSSEVRRLITAGDIEEANRLLGREYSMSGPVEFGDQVGRQLGFPTANIATEPNKLVPALGAYAGRAKLLPTKGDLLPTKREEVLPTKREEVLPTKREEVLPIDGEVAPKAPEGPTQAQQFVAALSVGYRPTFGGTQLRVEAFLLDYEGDLYQQRLELRFISYLHPDIKFPSPDDLVRQLKQDVADTRRIVRG
jgi:riboflavin kinase/FMN adenylyltransferase